MFRFLLLLVLSLASAGTAAVAKNSYIQAELIAESRHPRPGGTVLIGLRMVPRPGWHGYWSNPGEAGLAPEIAWTAPDGVSFGPLSHPAPTLLQVAGVTSFVHEGPFLLLSRMTIDPSLPVGTPLPITAKVHWAACSDELCVPERTTLSLQLAAGDGRLSADAPVLRKALSEQPVKKRGGGFYAKDGSLQIELPDGLALRPTEVRFFPDGNGIFDAARAHVTSRKPIRIIAPLGEIASDRLTGVVSDGINAYRLALSRSPAPPTPSDAAAEPAALSSWEGTPVKKKFMQGSPAKLTSPLVVQPKTEAPTSTNDPAEGRLGRAAGASALLAVGLITAAFAWRRRRTLSKRLRSP